VPNIEAIPVKERAYYEDFLLATTHNRTRVDFRYDVGFDLCEPERAELAVTHLDDDLFPVMRRLLDLLESMNKRTKTEQERQIVEDQRDRFRALSCWYRTQRNVTAWIAGVHGYLNAKERKKRQYYRRMVRDLVRDEIANARNLLELWETSRTNWMIVSDVAETTFIYYYKNFADLVRKKILLMEGHENDEPYVDPEFQWRVPGLPPKN
jgi:hypothetical protein